MTTRVKTIFITVGTTLFEPLIESATNPLFLNHIASHGFTRLVVQYGKGEMPQIRNDSNEENRELEEGQREGLYRLLSDEEEEKHTSQARSASPTIQWEVYKFKPSLEADMRDADLIISHAGAGSIMEGLEHCRERNSQTKENIHQKKLVVVINDRLMDNHQCELAYALKKRRYLFVLSKPDMLLDAGEIKEIIDTFQPKCFEGGNNYSFGRLVDDFMGYAKSG